MRRLIKGLTLVCAGMLLASGLQAEDQNPPRVKVEVNKISEHPTSLPLRASTLIGMNVRDASNQPLGTISDFVVDLQDNRIRYLAVSYGGFLGLGDKHFAVPVTAFQLRKDPNSDAHYLVLDIPEDRLKKAPGFNQGNWPNFADMNWQKEVDTYYTQPRGESQVE
ncbi:PRC-barrel domain-containing protein [Planctomicrobium sp. SH661]|uniref:PRC-barrel domain-containing protein n=1 Tax=Planctomicrobium sp. SH661 TaxID=3448124 RepID=UPI003F5C310F